MSLALARKLEFVRACAVHLELEEPDGTDVTVSTMGCASPQPSDEDRLKTCLFYGNRLEWGKAYHKHGHLGHSAPTESAL